MFDFYIFRSVALGIDFLLNERRERGTKNFLSIENKAWMKFLRNYCLMSCGRRADKKWANDRYYEENNKDIYKIWTFCILHSIIALIKFWYPMDPFSSSIANPSTEVKNKIYMYPVIFSSRMFFSTLNTFLYFS